jgi:hypothetical protein
MVPGDVIRRRFELGSQSFEIGLGGQDDEPSRFSHWRREHLLL